MKSYKHFRINKNKKSREVILEEYVEKSKKDIKKYDQIYKQIKSNFEKEYYGKVNIALERAKLKAKLNPESEKTRIKEYTIFIGNFIATTIIATGLSFLFVYLSSNSTGFWVISAIFILIGLASIFICKQINNIEKEVYGFDEKILYYYMALEVLDEIENEQKK